MYRQSWRFLAGFRILKQNYDYEKNLKPVGNMPETCQKPPRPVYGGFQRFLDDPSLLDHTVVFSKLPAVKKDHFWSFLFPDGFN